MKIEILTTFKYQGQTFTKEEVRIMDDEITTKFCKFGWAKDLSGQVETGSTDNTDTQISVDSVTTETRLGEVNG